MLEDVTVSLITERRVSQPWGLAGGEPGAVGENWLLPGGDEARAERLPGQVHAAAAGGRRPADAHAGRRRVGDTRPRLNADQPVRQAAVRRARRRDRTLIATRRARRSISPWRPGDVRASERVRMAALVQRCL